MDVLDPTATNDGTEREPLSPRVDDLEGKRIGLFGNGKLTAEPVLRTVGDRLAEKYPDATIEYYLLDELNKLKDDAQLDRIREWAREETDVVIGAMGDCGSCTKFLAWAIDAVEAGDTPGVGLLDEGFEMDWKSNAIERGRPLRYRKIPVRCEVVDRELIEEQMTAVEIEAIEAELTRPLTENEAHPTERAVVE